MIIGLDKIKYRKKITQLWILTLCLTALTSFVLSAYNSPLSQLDHDYSTDLTFTAFLTFISYVVLLFVIRLNKYASNAIFFENGKLNDFTKYKSKVRGLNIENIESISKWAKRKKINRYRIEVKLPSNKTKFYFISDNFVNSAELLKLAEFIGNEIAKRKIMEN